MRHRDLASRSASTNRPTDTVDSPPPGRVVVRVFIIAWLVWQIVVPLAYYLGDELEEERFSWRMFSGVWLLHKRCTTSVVEYLGQPGADGPGDVRAVDLERTLNATWVRQLTRNRRLVVEKFLRARCREDPAVSDVEFFRICPVTPYAAIPTVTVRLSCRSGVFAGSP